MTCTTAGSIRPWCSHTSVYQSGSEAYTYCDDNQGQSADDLYCEQYEGMSCGGQTAWRCSYAQWRLDFYGKWMASYMNNNFVSTIQCTIPESMVRCHDQSKRVCRQSAIPSCPVCYCSDHHYADLSVADMRYLWNQDYQIWNRVMKESSDRSNTC